MRKLALALFALGVGFALAGSALRLAAWSGQKTARAHWEEKAVEPVSSGDENLTRLSFPLRGIEFFVQSGASTQNLLRGPAWIKWSALPGENGNCIIVAHRDTHFSMLGDLKNGEQLIVQRSGRKYSYRIEKLAVVNAADLSFYQSSDGPVLTLVTCYPFSYLGKAPKRFIVRARLSETNS